MPRNDDMSLRLAKAAQNGFFPKVAENEINLLIKEAGELFDDDSIFVSGPDISVVGDSLNAQGGSTGENPGGFLAKYIDQTVYVDAVGGEGSTAIVARQGGNPYHVYPANGIIPESGPVTITVTSNPAGSWPLLQSNGNTSLGKVFAGKIAGVSGIISLVQPSGSNVVHQGDDYYVFTRTTPGSAVAVSQPVAFYTDFAIARRRDLMIIQAGRNSLAYPDQVVADIKAAINFLASGETRWLVVGVHNGTSEQNPSANYTNVITLNAKLAEFAGRRFVDQRTYLIKYGLAESSIEPTANDLADIAADTIPRSLLSDNVHYKIFTRRILGRLFANRLIELGWVKDTGKTLLISDTFDRADTNTLGPLWTGSTDFSIVSNRATRTSTSGTVVGILAVDMPTPDIEVSAAITKGTAGTVGLVARYVDDNNLYGTRISSTNGNMVIYRLQNGVVTALTGMDNLFTVEGSTVRLTMKGNVYKIYVNEVLALTYTDPNPQFTDAKKVGIRCDSHATVRPKYENFTAQVAI
ncbi:minor tail protein [Arthrobacter phage Nellie]|uniref:Minor tail protein n=4 Tax=Jasminevirus adat TaxID=2560299 RepID=A0A249XN61_9CAUD|nr:tail fiber protein [Arthrobacter phage Adat]ASZ72589.1 minor tail protein [Arthrobacter phage Adat]ASZ73171.1 minor tail protein [Arthrobacter phage GurgleFerb]ASZ73735.1 minor tail protein [Arthrobacter phage Nellie]AXH43705.1 minor tail protein [Arthrobacter phage Brad]